VRASSFSWLGRTTPLLWAILVISVYGERRKRSRRERPDRQSITEALRNAIFHGNLDLSMEQTRIAVEQDSSSLSIVREQSPYCNRRVHFHATLSPREVQVVIGDDGPGFDVAHLPDVAADPACLTSEGGRGLVLIDMFMDEVRFNATGSEITLVKGAMDSGTSA
jgi:anti-sigma regulatory factor (Ser/Thr protein kinase)